MKNKTKCKVCLSGNIEKFIDYGNHPVSHHYISHEDEFNGDARIPLVLCQCVKCGIIELEQTADLSFYNIRFPWVRQNESEAHLDDLVNKIISLPGINNKSSIWGLSYKDKTTVDRFREIGFTQCKTMDYATFFNSQDQIYNIAFIQSFINENTIEEMRGNFGKPNVVICRHLLEHSHEPSNFLISLKMLVSGGNYVILELPDCGRLIENLDYTMIWEEHITYHTEISLQTAVRMHSMEIIYSKIYKYPYENCLILIVSDSQRKGDLFPTKEKINESMQAFKNYSGSFQNIKDKVYLLFNKLKSKNQKLAVYGSGHIASTFINTFGIDKYIEFVIDDDANKTELLMPGNGISIYPSNKILTEKIDLCFIAMSHENEQKVFKNNQEFINNGGQLVPISPNAANSIYDML